MNKHPLSLGHMDHDRSPSPKRKKIRQKYAPKACVSCRRSKLKCTGENPCQRCVDNGKRCFYSEDQTAAEVLQNLSRPTPAPTTTPQPNFGTGNGVSRRNVMPRHQPVERRASDASGFGMTMESRMARIEAMMEALVQDRGLAFTPSGSIERDESDGHGSESAFSMPILDPIHPALDSMTQQSPEHIPPPSLGNDQTMHVRAGSGMLPFPLPNRHEKYVKTFFDEVHPRHPCVDEAMFNARAHRLVSDGATEPGDIRFLAFCYLVFAYSDVVLGAPKQWGPSGEGQWGPTGQLIPTISLNEKPLGWQWFLLAESLIDEKSLLNVCNDDLVVQLLLHKALYLNYVDMPMMAYNSIRIACTAALQQNLHQQMMGTGRDPDILYWRVSLFWNVFIADHSISTSCGRPVSFHIEDVQVEMPDAIFNRASFSTREINKDLNNCLKFQILTAQLTAIVSAHASKNKRHEKFPETREIERKMKHMLDTVLRYKEPSSFPRQIRVIHNPKAFHGLNSLIVPLIAGRRVMTSMTYDRDQAFRFLGLARFGMEKVEEMWGICDIEDMVSNSSMHQFPSLLAGIILVYASVILRDHSTPDRDSLKQNYSEYVENCMEAIVALSEVAQRSIYGKRVHEDCSSISNLVRAISEKHKSLYGWNHPSPSWEFAKDMIPPNVVDLFPYQALSPSFQVPGGFNGDTLEGWADVRGNGSGVLWLF
ncbi:hypothetical protein GQ44DRAFT_694852 [Phaeosphaeriaceae sp. PMI808]|nr:hypothetical protein GQ44DRAFT_694852 [Phaeosphaeriaceae sp. PMI808]